MGTPGASTGVERADRDDDHGAVDATGYVMAESPAHVLALLRMRRVVDPQTGPALEMDLRPEVINPHGSLHGGLMGALIECGAAGAAVSAAGTQNIVASDMLIRYLTTVRVGPARVVTTVLRKGKRTLVVQADVIDVGAQRRLVATATLSYTVLDGG
jgi:uncharacterized protein (TIGR00369 family)